MVRRQNNPLTFEGHEFYCTECGKKGIPLPRQKGRAREKGHIKHMWCVNCRKRTAHIECRNDLEVAEVRAKVRREKMTQIKMINVNQLDPHPDNPRKDLGDLTDLTASVKAMGVLSPLMVITKPDGNYRIVAGHRRAAAAKRAGVKEVPCIISKMSALEQQYAMWTENEQRQQLSPVEQAGGIQMMLDLGATVDEVAEKTGLSKKTVKGRAEIAKLDRAVIAKREKDKSSYQLSIKDYEELSRIKSVKKRNEVLQKNINSENDLVQKVNAAIRAEEEEKALNKLIPIMKERGFLESKNSSISWNTYGPDGWEHLQKGEITKIKTIDVQPDLDRQIFWYVNYGTLYIAAQKKESQEEREKKKKLAQEEIERKKAEKELGGLIKMFREELDDFALGIYQGRINCTITNGEAIERAWRLFSDVGANAPADEIEDFMSEIVHRDRALDVEELKKATEYVLDSKPVLKQMMMSIHMEIRSDLDRIRDWQNRYVPRYGRTVRRYWHLLEIAYQYDLGNEEYEDIIDGSHKLYAEES